MTSCDCKMTGMPWISPYLCVVDVDQAIDFYQSAFGFSIVGEVVKNEEGISVHCELKYQDTVVMLGKQGIWNKDVFAPVSNQVESPISLYAYCENVDEFCLHAEKQGAEVLLAPEDTFWGDRMCRLKDLNGYIWAFATNIHPKLDIEN